MRSKHKLPTWFEQHCAHWNRYGYRNLFDTWREQGFTRQSLAEYQSAIEDVLCIGVTGSVGKSTLAHFLAEMLRDPTRSVYKTRVNDNWLPQIPFVLHHIAKRQPDVAIIECGVTRHGDARALSYLVPFRIVALTELVPVHLKEFDTIQRLANEKLRLISARDKPLLFSHSANRTLLSGRGLSPSYYGPNTDYSSSRIRVMRSATRLCLRLPRGTMSVTCPLVGYHVGDAIAGASAVAEGLFAPVPKNTIQERLAQIAPLPLRMQKHFVDDITFFVDTANANRLSITNAVRTFLDLPGSGQKHVILSGFSGMGGALADEIEYVRQSLSRLPLQRLTTLTLVGKELQPIARRVHRLFPNLRVTVLSSLEEAHNIDLRRYTGSHVLIRSATRSGKNLANIIPGFRQASDETTSIGLA